MKLSNLIKEMIQTNKYYFFSQNEINKISKKSIYKLGNEQTITLSDYSRYQMYNKKLEQFAGDIDFNYIYRSNTPLRIFDRTSEKDIQFCFKNNIINIENLIRYYGIESTDVSFILNKLSTEIDYTIGHYIFDMNKFKVYYDGITDKNYKSNITVLLDNFKENCKLIDGNVLRFKKDQNSIDLKIPDNIISNLIKYTDETGKRLNPQVKEWLLKNYIKPYSSKILYRAVGVQFDDWGNWSKVEISKIESILKKYFGVKKLEDIQVKKNIISNRGKESSWSTTPQISKHFATGMAKKSINFLIKAEIPADKIIVDFTILPEEYKDDFKYLIQNECIVDVGKISGVISALWLDKKFIEYLEEKGYKFIPQKGIIKI